LRRQSDTVRYVSGLAQLPAWLRGLDGYIPDVLALAAFVALVVWLFWLW
jgi:hypothetical protein